MDIDLNLTLTGSGTINCRHCSTLVGDSATDPMAHALSNERASTAAGPGVHADPAQFTDRPILLRQRFCPGCLALLATEIVPAGEPTFRQWTLQ